MVTEGKRNGPFPSSHVTDLATSAEGARLEPCLTRAPNMNQESSLGENWSHPLGSNWCSNLVIMMYIVTNITTELNTISIQTGNQLITEYHKRYQISNVSKVVYSQFSMMQEEEMEKISI